jgi:hypothetical protein
MRLPQEVCYEPTSFGRKVCYLGVVEVDCRRLLIDVDECAVALEALESQGERAHTTESARRKLHVHEPGHYTRGVRINGVLMADDLYPSNIDPKPRRIQKDIRQHTYKVHRHC